MSKKKKRPFARIAITLPPEVLAAADRLARRLDRSRSWVIAEAIRRFSGQTPALGVPTTVREAPSDYSAGLGPLRLAQLESDLLLTPEERVKAAEATARLDRVLRPSLGQRIQFLDRREDYLAWSQREAIRP